MEYCWDLPPHFSTFALNSKKKEKKKKEKKERNPQLSCRLSPSVDQILCQINTGMGAGDGDLSVSGALHWVGNLDLSARYLTYFSNLRALSADDATNELKQRENRTFSHQAV